MAGSSERMLRLLSLLQTHRYWSGPELSARLEVSERTLRRDVERLRGLGYPVEATRGVAGGYQLQAGASLPPLLVADDEAVAIAVGLQASAGTGAEGLDDAVVRALSKIVQVMPPKLRRRVKALQDYTDRGPMFGPPIDAVLLASLAQACRDEERLELVYRRVDGDRSRRTLEPHRLVSLGRRWYLVAYDLGRGDWRTFRVDRMSEPRPTGVRFRPRELPADDAAAYVKQAIAALSPTTDVDFVLHAEAERVAAVVRWWGTVEPLEPGPSGPRSRVAMAVDTFDWVVFVIAAVGAPYEVAGPPALAEHLRRAGGLLLGAGRG